MKVFWAWQSDLDGKISRHFIKDALEKAIDSLNEHVDIQSRPDNDENITLDHDRKNIPGSPDLAATIFKKISEAKVFVGDVTPIATTEQGKKIANPNVAIELGYALSSLGDQQILLIMNEAFGARDDLPFDIRHKAGPLTYNLPKGANKQAIDEEKKRLTNTLQNALRLYRDNPVSPPPPLFERLGSPNSDGFFRTPGTVLATSLNYMPPMEHSIDAGSHLYIRVSPKFALAKPFDLSAMKLARSQLGAFSTHFSLQDESDIWHRENDWGIIEFQSTRSSKELIGNLTQCFRSGEIWGINTESLAPGNGTSRQINSTLVEGAFRNALTRYIAYHTNFMGIQFPLVVESGVMGVLNRVIVTSGTVLDNNLKIAKKDIILKDEIAQEDDIQRYLLKLFEKIHLTTGRERPKNLNGFPPSQN